ncbi:MAG TPA: outer membrane beta-barrel protein [Flavisolibacter sp.]|jgi:hypothetical protein|nr:outer membrane beta-barrel protein [Flavisolibacter sp.]
MQLFKGLFFLTLFAGSWTISKAQVRIFAGTQFTTAKYTIQNVKQETEFKQGYMAGIGLTYQVEGPLYFAPSLYFSQKGYKVSSYNLPSIPPNEDARNNDVTLRTIALTPLLQFNFSKKESFAFVRLGPGFEKAISGREVFDSAGIKTIDRNMTFSSTAYSPATAFFNFQLGYQLANGLSILAHYEHGLSSLNNRDLGPMILQRAAGIMVSWRFRND